MSGRGRRIAVALGAVAAVVLLLSSTSARAQTPPDGQMLYQVFCGFCHGADGTGQFPILRTVVGSRSCLIQASIDYWVPSMVEFTPLKMLAPDEVAAIADYLNTLSPTPQDRYEVSCAGCHGLNAMEPNRVGEGVTGESADDILDAVHDEDAMLPLRCLPESDAREIEAYLRSLEPPDDDEDSE